LPTWGDQRVKPAAVRVGVDSMFNQHAKWLETTNRIAWRRPVPSLNYLLSSHV
jgi:phosphoketolase